MVNRDNYIMFQVENTICGCVNTTLGKKSYVAVDDVYKGKTNIPFIRSVARNFIFVVLHNNYGFSYSMIAQRADMKVESVMRCVRKWKTMYKYDTSYQKVGKLVAKRLSIAYERK